MSDNPPEMKPIPDMTDREIAEETLYWMRTAGAAFAQIQSQGIGGILTGMMKSNKR